MGADISRVRFDGRRDFAAVVLQQGRLLLDGDFNEYVAMLDRRLRAETVDLTSFGPTPVHPNAAWVPRQTPDAFRVTVTAGKAAIGRGRMYVDGLLAENHGVGDKGFDALLREQTGTADTPYESQPYWLTPAALPTGGTSLAYLDVWEREVTALEDPDLVEIAVGVDTTARRQVVWQVRLLPNVGSASCFSADGDIPGWLDVITPSAGRLTTGTIPVDPADDPCLLPPSGGYRGLENQTYRVEIHDGGAPGTATFSWSRENGSVAFPVVEMVSPTVLRLSSIGKDDVLRVKTGDWVEILDDRSELDQRPGVMRKVTVDDAARTVTFAGVLPADLRPASAADAAARHTRVRRWDQAGTVKSAAGATLANLDAAGASGLITVPATNTTKVVLEHGVVVSFSMAVVGGKFRSGDHWIFAARTADTSVEVLDDAPPDGIHHHYARLGFVTQPDSETDCRRLWPPIVTGDGGEECACTVCVSPEQHASGVLTVQMALDLVAGKGGTVCLAPGAYDVGQGLRIDRARSVRLHGQGPATVLIGRQTVLTIERSMAVRVDDLAMIGGRGATPAVRLRSVVDTTIEDTVVVSFGAGVEVAVRTRSFGSAIELSGVVANSNVTSNILVGEVGIDAGGSDKLALVTAGLRIDANVVVGWATGIAVGGRTAHLIACRIDDNEVLAARADGIVADGLVYPGGSLDVTGNRILATGAGIVVGADAMVASNTINSLRSAPGGDGIVAGPGVFDVPPGHVSVVGNRVHGRGGTGIALRTAVRSWTVTGNVVDGAGIGIANEARGRSADVSVHGNEVRDVGNAEGAKGSVVGILVNHAASASVADNTVIGVARIQADLRVRAGIIVVACGEARVTGNTVDEVGPSEGFVGDAFGIALLGPFGTSIVGHNSVRRSKAVPDAEGRWIALLASSAGAVALTGSAGVKVLMGESAGAVLTNGWAYSVAVRADHVTCSSNALVGGGARPTCFVRVRGDAVADANQCDHLTINEPTAMHLEAGSVIASGNRVRDGKAMIVIVTPENRYSALGNLAGGGTHLFGPGNGLPGPWNALNLDVP